VPPGCTGTSKQTWSKHRCTPPGMGMVRGYLVISVILLIVKAIEVGTGGH